jgi:histidinol-phosphate aminotransferase
LFARHPAIAGEELYQALKEQKIFVRWFNQPRIKEYLRITVGTKAQMERLMTVLTTIIEEVKE